MGFSTNYIPRTKKSKLLDQSGEANFNGASGTVIPLQFRTSGNDTSYDITITPEENTSGNLGDYWVVKVPPSGGILL